MICMSSLVFSKLIMYLRVLFIYFLIILMLGFYFSSWVCGFIYFNIFGIFSAFFFFFYFSVFFLYLFILLWKLILQIHEKVWGCPNMHRIFSFFSCVSFYIFCIVISSSSLNLSFAIYSFAALNYFSIFLIAGIIVFISRSYKWISLNLPCLCLTLKLRNIVTITLLFTLH